MDPSEIEFVRYPAFIKKKNKKQQLWGQIASQFLAYELHYWMVCVGSYQNHFYFSSLFLQSHQFHDIENVKVL